MNKNLLILIAIIILTAVAGFFVYPKTEIFGRNISRVAFGSKFLPWRLGLDLVGGSHLVYEIDTSNVSPVDRDSVASGLKEVIERRVNLFGVSEPQVVVAKEGDSYRLIAELAGIKDINEAINQIGLTPLLEFYEVQEVGTSTQFIPTDLTGRYLKGARADFDQTTGMPFVTLEFDSEGAKIFDDLTARNVGRQICTLLDRQITENDCARVNERISGGKARITGRFTTEQVRKIVERFNAGALPAPIKLISQQTVGASLGQESLKKAIYAGVLGTAVIILFMMLYYRKFGIFASIALLIYIPLTLAIFKLFPGFTLSLAGIAGFILSIGMAVDANILIFERTKEEIRRGLSRVTAIEEGFRRAWPSIRDSNISTMITSAILYFATTSFVQGFALTLFIGVVISMFSSITITRILLRAIIKT